MPNTPKTVKSHPDATENNSYKAFVCTVLCDGTSILMCIASSIKTGMEREITCSIDVLYAAISRHCSPHPAAVPAGGFALAKQHAHASRLETTWNQPKVLGSDCGQHAGQPAASGCLPGKRSALQQLQLQQPCRCCNSPVATRRAQTISLCPVMLYCGLSS
jgi:hypothetical protein